MKSNLKTLFKIFLNYKCKISKFNCFFLGSVILHKLTTMAFTDTHSFGMVWPRNMNNISNES